MYSYHALLNALSAHMIRINLNTIFYTHVEQNNLNEVLYGPPPPPQHTHTHTYTHILLNVQVFTVVCFVNNIRRYTDVHVFMITNPGIQISAQTGANGEMCLFNSYLRIGFVSLSVCRYVRFSVSVSLCLCLSFFVSVSVSFFFFFFDFCEILTWSHSSMSMPHILYWATSTGTPNTPLRSCILYLVLFCS